jgi:hypothetical protein
MGDERASLRPPISSSFGAFDVSHADDRGGFKPLQATEEEYGEPGFDSSFGRSADAAAAVSTSAKSVVVVRRTALVNELLTRTRAAATGERARRASLTCGVPACTEA